MVFIVRRLQISLTDRRDRAGPNPFTFVDVPLDNALAPEAVAM